MCYFMNLHKNHKLLKINDEEELKKEKISIEDSSKNLDDNKNKLEELKNKIENEMIKIDKLYNKVDNEVTKSYEIKHEKLIKEEEGLKDKLKNEVTKIKEQLELNISNISDIIRNCERIIKGLQIFQKGEENNILKKLNYISNINKNQKEANLIFQQLMKNLNISFNDNNIKYEEYYFNGISAPKDIEFSNISTNSFKISWKIDEINLLNIDNKNIKFKVEIRKEKENEKFISVYEDINKYCEIKNLEEDTNYQVRICSLYNNIESNYSKIYRVKLSY